MASLRLPDVTEQLVARGYVLFALPPAARDVVRATFDTALTFFRSPQEQKNTSALAQECGYRPLAAEYSQMPDRPDLIESFTVASRVRPAEDDLMHGPAAMLYDVMSSAFEQLECLAEAMTIDLARTIRREEWGHLHGGLHRWSRLQLNYSTPSSIARSLIQDPHEDGNLLTIACATAPGLELQIDGEAFVPVHADGTHALAMLGDIARLLSGGLTRPIHHQIRPHPEIAERLSLMFFADLDPEHCLPWRKTTLNDAVDIGERVRRSAQRFGLTGFIGD